MSSTAGRPLVRRRSRSSRDGAPPERPGPAAAAGPPPGTSSPFSSSGLLPPATVPSQLGTPSAEVPRLDPSTPPSPRLMAHTRRTRGIIVVLQMCRVGTSYWMSWWSENRWDRTTAFWLGGLALWSLGSSLANLHSSIYTALKAVAASYVLHEGMLVRLMRAPVAFFDSTPLGRIINRFTKVPSSTLRALCAPIVRPPYAHHVSFCAPTMPSLCTHYVSSVLLLCAFSASTLLPTCTHSAAPMPPLFYPTRAYSK